MTTLLPEPEEKAELERLRQELMYGDPMTAATAAEELAETASSVDPTWTISVYDKMWVKIGELGDDLIELQGADPRNDIPTAKLKIKGESWLTDAFMSCKTTMVGVTLETAGIRFPFYVDTFDYEFDNGPTWTGTAALIGIYDILNYIQIWPQWFMPIQAQIQSHAVYIGPLCMCTENDDRRERAADAERHLGVRQQRAVASTPTSAPGSGRCCSPTATSSRC